MKKLSFATAATLTVMMTGMILPGVALATDLPGSTQDAENTQENQVTQQNIGTTNAQLNLQKAKTLLLQMLDRLETHFENTKAKAAALQKLTETTGIDIVQVIEGYIANIKNLKTRATNAASVVELKAVARDVHNLIMNARTDVRKNISRRVEVHIDNFTQKTERAKPLIDMAHRRITQLQNQGADIQTVNNDLKDCEDLMQKGNEHLQEAKNKFHQFQQMPGDQENEDGELMKDGLKIVRDARETFGQAHQDCSRVMKELRVVR